MKRIIISICVATSIAGLIVAGCAWMNIGEELAYEKPIPTEEKLADITNDLVIADIVWPNAESWSYNLVIGLSTNDVIYSVTNRACPDFVGEITITGPNNTHVEQFSVSSSNARYCNWLMNDHGLGGFILTWQQTNMLRSCTAGTQYSIRFDFERRSEVLQSLWLSFLQSQKQKEQKSPNKASQPIAGKPGSG